VQISNLAGESIDASGNEKTPNLKFERPTPVSLENAAGQFVISSYERTSRKLYDLFNGGLFSVVPIGTKQIRKQRNFLKPERGQ
jgi:hypothetical protein